MMVSGVFSICNAGLMTIEPNIIRKMEETAVKVMVLPMVFDRFSLSLEPKY